MPAFSQSELRCSFCHKEEDKVNLPVKLLRVLERHCVLGISCWQQCLETACDLKLVRSLLRDGGNDATE